MDLGTSWVQHEFDALHLAPLNCILRFKQFFQFSKIFLHCIPDLHNTCSASQFWEVYRFHTCIFSSILQSKNENTQSTKHKRDLCRCPLNISFCFDSGPALSRRFSNHFAAIPSVTEWHISSDCNVSLCFSRRWLGKKQQEKGKVYMTVEVGWSESKLFPALTPDLTQTQQAIVEKSFCLAISISLPIEKRQNICISQKGLPE